MYIQCLLHSFFHITTRQLLRKKVVWSPASVAYKLVILKMCASRPLFLSFSFFSFSLFFYISNTNSSTFLYGQERDEAKRLYEF